MVYYWTASVSHHQYIRAPTQHWGEHECAHNSVTQHGINGSLTWTSLAPVAQAHYHHGWYLSRRQWRHDHTHTHNPQRWTHRDTIWAVSSPTWGHLLPTTRPVVACLSTWSQWVTTVTCLQHTTCDNWWAWLIDGRGLYIYLTAGQMTDDHHHDIEVRWWEPCMV